MTDFARNGPASKRFQSYSAQQRLCRRLVQVSSVFFLPAVVMRRALGAKPAMQPAGQRLSVFAEARAGAAAVVPFIFMG
jgi:hypothetical protein